MMTDVSPMLQALTRHVAQHPHLKAAWLKGSQARGDADRHSDIDLCLWLAPEHAETFRAELEPWLAQLYPVVRFHILFDAMVSALLQLVPDELLALHLFLDTGDAPNLEPGHHRLLWDRDDVVTFKADEVVSLEVMREELDVALRYFWTLFLSLPGIERGELISAVARLSHLTGQLVIVCGLGRGRPRRIGEDRGNVLLNDDERQAIELALTLPEITPVALVRSHLRLADLLRVNGRAAAESLGTKYPEELEGAVLAHVHRELERQGLSLLN